MMFPYPSAEGLHVGNMFAFTGSDVYGRFKRLQGYDVFEPIGYDAFGIHSENYAIKMGINPAILIPKNIENFRRQLKRIGGMFDWRHELSTTDPAYYKWTQWIFLQLLKAGKAYKKSAAVNWCPADKTVLANEQVINGHCERCGAAVEQRVLEQWFFRITEYADRLLADLDDKSKMDWSESTTTAQRNWLGRSEGAELDFPLAAAIPQSDGDADEPVIRVYTTRPDTVFGATFMVLAPEHPLVDALTTGAQRKVVDAYRKQAAAKDLVSRKVGEKEKTGVFTGGYAVNPATGQPIPVWVADYVLMEYGTGAIMAVPGHDERDFEFAKKFELPIVRVVAEPDGSGRRAARRRRVHRERAGPAGPLGQVRRDGRPRGQARHHRLARRARGGEGGGPLPPPRLVHQPPALLGPADPDHLLRPARRRAGPGEGPAGRAAADRGLHPGRHRHLPARAPRVVVPRALPDLRQAGPARDRRERHLPRLGVVLPALPEQRPERRAVRPGADEEVAAGHDLHRRQRARGACTCSTRASSPWCCTTWGCCTSTSRSGGSGPTG